MNERHEGVNMKIGRIIRPHEEYGASRSHEQESFSDHRTVQMPAIDPIAENEHVEESDIWDLEDQFIGISENAELGDEWTVEDVDTEAVVALSEAQRTLQALDCERRDLRSKLAVTTAELAKAQEALSKSTAARTALEASHKNTEFTAITELLTELMPVVDTTNRAMRLIEDSTCDEELTRAVRKVDRGLILSLATVGFHPFSAKVQPYDAVLHEIVEHVVSEVVAPGTVVDLYRFGYFFRGQVMRKAQVVVAIKAEQSE
jgi:molecular chaperone GrpE (heat shock protein)